ncbi:MAG: hypothetical protein AAGN82_30160 [Myxococcota bacterium]
MPCPRVRLLGRPGVFALVVAVWVLTGLATPPAAAQGIGPGLGGPGQGIGPPGAGLPGGAPTPAPNEPEGPETHAASGGDNSLLPTEAAQLPEKPNEVGKGLVGKLTTDFNPDAEIEVGREAVTEREFYGVYYRERSGDYSFQGIFPPLWIERRQGDDRASLFGLTYFNRRSEHHDADVVFPIFWKLRDHDTYTTVVGNVMHRESPTGHDNWVAPFFFEGSGQGGKEYLHIPPLLTFNTRTDHNGFSMYGPVFCKWTGGPRCDGRTADEIDYGLAPLYFYGRDDRSEYEVIPPLLRYYSYEEKNDQEYDIWGPVWTEKNRDGGVVNVLPLFYHSWGENRASTTLAPFFHYSYEGPQKRTIATPLFVDHIQDDGAHTFATYLYARHRGRTELDMYTPLVWHYVDPDIDLDRWLALPFYYRETSNRSDNFALFPFYGQFKRHGLSREWWVTPLFRHKRSITGWQTDLYPLFYSGRTYDKSHVVLAPFFFDFNRPGHRSTVVAPLFWRFKSPRGLDQVIGNTYYGETKTPQGTEWQFHFFPFFSFGETPRGHWWNVLYGLAGYSQSGTRSRMRLAYIPITLSQ